MGIIIYLRPSEILFLSKDFFKKNFRLGKKIRKYKKVKEKNNGEK